MFRTNSKINVFSETTLLSYLEDKNVLRLPEDYSKTVLGLDIEKEAQRLAERNKVELIDIPNYEDLEKDIKMKDVQVNPYEDPRGGTKKVAFAVFTLKHNVKDINLFKVRPNNFHKEICEVEVDNNSLTFEIRTNYAIPELSPDVKAEVKKLRLQILEDIKTKVEWLNKEIEETNTQFYKFYYDLLEKEKTKASKRKSDLDDM